MKLALTAVDSDWCVLVVITSVCCHHYINMCYLVCNPFTVGLFMEHANIFSNQSLTDNYIETW